MKTKTLPSKSPLRKTMIFGVFLLAGLAFGNNKSMACSVNFTTTPGINGHYTFNGTYAGFSFSPTFSWNAGDGSGWHWGTTTFNHIFIANGTFNVKFAGNDSLCFDTVTIPVTVTNVTTPCTLSASFTVSYGLHGQVTFTSTSGGVNANTLYFWTPGDSNERRQEPSVYTHTYAWNGYYTVWLTVEDTGSAYCIDSVPENITVTNGDSGCHFRPNFTYTLDTNGQVTFKCTTRGLPPWSIYTWTMGDTAGYISGYNDSTFVYTYKYDGTHDVTLHLSADSSFCTDSITIPVTVTNACNLNVQFTYQYDSNGQVKFTSTTIGAHAGAQYGWSFGDGSSVNGKDTATHGYPFLGYYTVTLTVVNPGGCTQSDSETIYIYNRDSLSASFLYQSDSLFAGTYNFWSTSRGTDAFTYYKWTPGDGDPSDSGLGMTTYTHTYVHNGPYSATLTIWYTVLPHRFNSPSPRYDLSSYTLVINVSSATGINTIADNSWYTVYPNPSNGTFNIEVNGMENEKNAEVRISNMMGQVVYQTNTTVKGGNTLNNISLPENAASGIYLLQIITPDNTYTSRIAIQK